eukprot:1293169-Amphidinium_carterae.1
MVGTTAHMLVVRLLALAVCAKGGRVEVHDSESVLVEYASQGALLSCDVPQKVLPCRLKLW